MACAKGRTARRIVLCVAAAENNSIDVCTGTARTHVVSSLTLGRFGGIPNTSASVRVEHAARRRRRRKTMTRRAAMVSENRGSGGSGTWVHVAGEACARGIEPAHDRRRLSGPCRVIAIVTGRHRPHAGSSIGRQSSGCRSGRVAGHRGQRTYRRQRSRRSRTCFCRR